jgi:cytoskeleton protein RodZ
MSSRDMASPAEAVCAGSGVGADLKLARERLGCQLSEIAASLRIRAAHLQALEEGRTADLPGNVYAIGYLRSYAKALGLDPDEFARRFKSETLQLTSRTELAFPAPVPERGVPAGAVVLLGVVLAAGAYVGWYRLSGQGKLPAEVVPPVPERLAPLAAQVAPAPAPARTTVPPSSASPPPVSAPGPFPTATPAPTTQAPPAQIAEPPANLPSVPPSSAAAAIPASTDATQATQGGPEIADEPRIVLRAKDDAWMQVRDHSGQVLLNRVLRGGETWPVPQKSSLLLTTGNAGGTELVVDGVVAPSIGNPGAVRRDLPLDPDTIKAGKLPAQLQAAAQSSIGRTSPAQ